MPLTNIIAEYFINLGEKSFQNRENHIWNKSIDIFLSNNLFYLIGLGMKGLKSYYGIEGAHNNYLAFIIDFGIVGGFISILLLYFLVPYIVFKFSKKEERKIIVSIVVFLSLVSFVHEPFYHPTILAILSFFYAIILKCNHNNRIYKINKVYKDEKSISS